MGAVVLPPRAPTPVPPPPAPGPAGSGAAPPSKGWAPSTLLTLGVAFATAVVAMWAIHGGSTALGDGWPAATTSLTKLTGLLASAAGLVGVVLITRPRRVEATVGLDRLFVWHRWLGATTALLVAAHVATAIVSASTDVGPATAIADLTGRQAYMAMATVGAGLVGMVTITSIRSIRRRLSYEAWYFIHLTAYLGLALSFAHQVFLGSDFADDAAARVAWIGVHVAVVVAVIWGRWGRLLAASLRPLTVTQATPASDDSVALWLGGRNAGSTGAAAGQFFLLRALRPRLWWHAHPFSLSAAPRGDGLRFTIKQRGDGSAALARLPIGARVVAEGPYGSLTPDALGNRRAVFVVGGVGVAPALAIVEALPADAEPIVLWRARREEDLVHRSELERAVAARGGRVEVLVGPTSMLGTTDPFAADALRATIPDLADRAAVVCGPERLLHAARRGLVAAGVPTDRIHAERPWW